MCVPHYKGSKDIPVVQWWEDKTEYGEPMIFVVGADGYNYRLIQVKRRAGFVELDPSPPDSATRDGHHEDWTVYVFVHSPTSASPEPRPPRTTPNR